jgi:hypothetical protein
METHVDNVKRADRRQHAIIYPRLHSEENEENEETAGKNILRPVQTLSFLI